MCMVLRLGVYYCSSICTVLLQLDLYEQWIDVISMETKSSNKNKIEYLLSTNEQLKVMIALNESPVRP